MASLDVNVSNEASATVAANISAVASARRIDDHCSVQLSRRSYQLLCDIPFRDPVRNQQSRSEMRRQESLEGSEGKLNFSIVPRLQTYDVIADCPSLSA